MGGKFGRQLGIFLGVISLSFFHSIIQSPFMSVRRTRWSQELIYHLENLSAYEGVGEKARNLSNLVNLNMAVPEGFVITRKGYERYKNERTIPPYLWDRILDELEELERTTGKQFGRGYNPLLLSVRSAPPEAMPGILLTVLNIGINDSVIAGLMEKGGGGNEGMKFAYDTYRRFIESFISGVYPEKVTGGYYFTVLKEEFLKNKGKSNLESLTGDEMRELVMFYLERLKEEKGILIPQDPYEQLKIALEAIYSSWDSELAVRYRKENDICDESGLEIIIQRMVFGNLNQNSGSGVAYVLKGFDSDIGGEGWIETDIKIYYSSQAQGSDLMTPSTKIELQRIYPYLREAHSPVNDSPLERARFELSKYLWQISELYDQPQEIEFTIENGQVYILQIRPAKNLFYEESVLIKEAFNNPLEVLHRIQEIGTRIQQRNWQVYRSCENFPSLLPGVSREAFGRGVVKGKLCFSLEEAERILEAGGAPILYIARRDEEVIKAMLEGKIAGIITTYGTPVMHEAIIAWIYLIPGVIIPSSSVEKMGGDAIRIGGEVLKEGDDIVISAKGLLGEVGRWTPEGKLYEPYWSPEIINLDIDNYEQEVRETYAHLGYEELIQEHNELWRQLLEAIWKDEAWRGISLEEVLFLNIKVHFLHKLIYEAGEKMGKTKEEIMRDITAANFPERGHGVIEIGSYFFELADSSTLDTLGAYTIINTGEFSRVILGEVNPPVGPDRVFMCMASRYGYFIVNRDQLKPEDIPIIKGFLEFCRRELKGENGEDYFRVHTIYKIGNTHGDETVVFNFYGISFPRSKKAEVLELLQRYFGNK